MSTVHYTGPSIQAVRIYVYFLRQARRGVGR